MLINSYRFNSNNRIVVGRFEEVDLQLVDTEIFTVNRSRLYQLKKSHLLQHEISSKLSDVHFVLIRDDTILEPPEHYFLS